MRDFRNTEVCFLDPETLRCASGGEMNHVTALRERGYAIVRGVFPQREIDAVAAELDIIIAEGMRHPCSYRHQNVLFEVCHSPETGERFVIQAHWFSWLNELLDAFRHDPKVFALLEPLLGRDIKQIANQVHWKPPGAPFASYRYHQDLKFRERPDLFGDLIGGSVTVGVAIDAQNADNGALQVYPGSHEMGYLHLAEDGINLGNTGHETPGFREAGLDPDQLVTCDLEPGDVVLWTLLTVHGSLVNTSNRDRAFVLNSYMRASETPVRGEWAWRDGVGVPLSGEPEICKYEQLRENPGPEYINREAPLTPCP
jgi:hypothetical protein